MQRILIKTTIPFTEDDWHVGRFSLLQQHLRSFTDTSGKPLYEVDARDRVANHANCDVDLLAAGEGAYDQVWLIGVDSTGALTPGDTDAIDRFRHSGGGLLLTRDHQDLGSSLCTISVIGATQHFQRANPESDRSRHCIDDAESLQISWPNYHSGCNGDAQRILVAQPLHPLMERTRGGALEWLPAHPHEGVVSVPTEVAEVARVVATGRSLRTGNTFNLIVVVEAGERSGGGRVVADSSFHHFCDCNWDPAAGAPSFVDEPWGDGMRSPDAHADARRYVENIATWLGSSRGPGPLTPEVRRLKRFTRRHERAPEACRAAGSNRATSLRQNRWMERSNLTTSPRGKTRAGVGFSIETKIRQSGLINLTHLM